MFGIPKFDDVFAGGMDIDPARAGELLAWGFMLVGISLMVWEAWKKRETPEK